MHMVIITSGEFNVSKKEQGESGYKMLLIQVHIYAGANMTAAVDRLLHIMAVNSKKKYKIPLDYSDFL